MKKINLIPLESTDHLIQPEEFSDITLDSPATAIFTDFKKYKPLVIDADIPAKNARYLMQKAHVRLKLVIDENDELIGTLSLNELDEQKFFMLHAQGVDREDVLVSDVMVPRSDVRAISYEELQLASISDVIESLKQNGTQHCLVIDLKQHYIRGVISATDIARRLHMPLEIHKPTTFVDIFVAVNG